ncbi:unnamed protein product, partial [Mesorhabditis belari]|uniref:Uncharacterized protein n=1 Tax=Mesorhabditis belari TaxID=2138241 RepID=A0AAF3EZF3_9BILA
MLREAVFLLFAVYCTAEPTRGTRCAKNQVINRLTVYEDGALEAECGPIPCGMSAMRCIEDQTSCRADTDVFSGMRWAANGQSVLLRCCTLKVANKIYVGTDLVSAGSYYVGGPVSQQDLYGQGGPEYDFIANIRTEQGGVRVWVYRIMCPVGAEDVETQPGEEQEEQAQEEHEEHEEHEGHEGHEGHEEQEEQVQKKHFEKRRDYLLKRLGAHGAAESIDEMPEEVAAEDEAVNPLQYRPANMKH